MVKASVFLMLVLTVLVFMGLRWRERRTTTALPGPRLGWIARQRAQADRWVTAAAIAAVGTTVLLGGLHWLRVWQG
ncbi:hypothetical protein EJV46_00160 [Roseococcus sp. SYP-B2431]|uniref:hypothetical protein n=1 Tax=Roseococcus sp. SYP-B2431 TaxID=2496640 RepID=UPI00103BB282|nr:hypothetical protein [Roseococcus sp. SYP-B2431]TCI00907.1 hypothetical protein EJV46_00160 [Roseococcus sp. SYP-B2431]